MRIAIIGGGAAGFFAAINVKENFPLSKVVIFEKSNKVLSKVKISGGGRCNVTNAAETIKELALAYPRGDKFLKKSFGTFSNKDAFNWFEKNGVPLIVQSDNCVFPKSQNSKSIIQCFVNEVNRLSIKIQLKHEVLSIDIENSKLKLSFKERASLLFDKVIVTSGGSPKVKGLNWLIKLGHSIQRPVPSLFTFNMPNEPITKLMGIVVENALVSIQSTNFKSKGALLITHWGMSGPVILKLSSFAARTLNDLDYNFKIRVNWVNIVNTEIIKLTLENLIKDYPKKQLSTIKPFQLQTRLWLYLLDKLGFESNRKWNEIGNKGINKLVNILTNDMYSIEGKTTFKEEFVTCGGIDLSNINYKTMQSKVVDNLYFAGEVLDIDGITGGYNFQAAWTTAFIAAKLQS